MTDGTNPKDAWQSSFLRFHACAYCCLWQDRQSSEVWKAGDYNLNLRAVALLSFTDSAELHLFNLSCCITIEFQDVGERTGNICKQLRQREAGISQRSGECSRGVCKFGRCSIIVGQAHEPHSSTAYRLWTYPILEKNRINCHSQRTFNEWGETTRP